MAAQFFTYTVTNDIFVITEEMGLNALSIDLESGAGTYTGGLTIVGIASTAIALGTKPVTLSTMSEKPISGITIDCSGGGVINLIGRR